MTKQYKVGEVIKVKTRDDIAYKIISEKFKTLEGPTYIAIPVGKHKLWIDFSGYGIPLYNIKRKLSKEEVMVLMI